MIDEQLLRIIKRGLSDKVGKSQAITSAKIVEALKSKGFTISGAILREHINHLRTIEGLFICGDNSGYYLAANEDEAVHQIKSLQSRVNEIQKVIESLKDSYKNKFSQYHLFE